MPQPFLKWAGGKRWIISRHDFTLPSFSGKYFEPFLGGAAIFFHLSPKSAVLSDVNPRLIDTYKALKEDWAAVYDILKRHQQMHSKDHYYATRSNWSSDIFERAAQFIYLNRTCWNGLYRENLKGEFNVPMGSKDWVISEDDDFASIGAALKYADIKCADFEGVIDDSSEGDLVFVDPPYTTAHNMNGFVKYNESIFTWEDQVRLRDSIVRAVERGAKVVMTNADHSSLRQIYEGVGVCKSVARASVISGASSGRGKTTELLLSVGPRGR
ncbi:DNA adenine methylase [Rhodobacter capsulatus]|uniref:DNA adenine methylase n=1 Tax=Rhodobacter capsulatus TaxID=1061 RepID=UPI0009BD2558|nr:Dam family site-specific DNA-(adenine-N6)-methyltransferase [Rhodobacter capsulatus]